MRPAVLTLCVALVMAAAEGGPLGPPTPAGGSGKIELEDPCDLGIKGTRPARLSPDGRRVVFIERTANRKYAYHIIGTDGKNKAKLYDSAVGWDDIFSLCFGHGIWSPDGSLLAVATADDAKGRNPRMALYDVAAKKETLLPCNLGATIGALFGADGAVYYVDTRPLREDHLRCALKRYDPKAKTVVELLAVPEGVIACITMSPDRRRIGGIAVRAHRPERKEEMRLWAYDIATKKTAESIPMRFDDYFFDGAPVVFWDPGGGALYANASSGKNRRPFSIARFRPFPTTKKETKLLQEKRSLLAAGAFAPGKLSVASKGGHKVAKTLAKALVLDVRTDKTTDCNLPLLLIDRRGRIGLFADLRTRTLCTATIRLK